MEFPKNSIKSQLGSSLDTGGGEEAAIDRDGDAGDEGGLVVVEEPLDAAEQFGCFAKSLQRSVLHDIFAALRKAAVGSAQIFDASLVDEEAGGHGVHADVRGGEVVGEPLGEIEDGGLAHRVGGHAGQGAVGVHRGEVQDAPAAGARHLCTEDAARDDGSQGVDFQDALEGVHGQSQKAPLVVGKGVVEFAWIELGEGGHGVDVVAAGAVDQEVAVAPVGGDGGGDFAHPRLVSDVAWLDAGDAARLRDLRGGRLQFGGGAADQHDLHALGRQKDGDFRAERSAGARDNYNLMVPVHC